MNLNLNNKGVIGMINIQTIKPLDEQAIINLVKKTGCVVTAEEHNSLAELGRVLPVPWQRIIQHRRNLWPQRILSGKAERLKNYSKSMV
ncbi:transketolase-like protein [Salegentibacter sp. 24]|nr:transketolase-like protein [Salegentibacter sp. 24]